MEILSREWYLEGKLISYEVGQPMGAYSSFAMLALTHHVIVHIAASRAGYHPSKIIYMILGDDGAMANDKVAKSYREIFSYLGMEINPIKGFEGTVLEFAKQLYLINNINISPLGAKNIMLAMRFVEFLPTVLYELMVKRFPLFMNFKVGRPKKTSFEIRMSEMIDLVRNRSYTMLSEDVQRTCRVLRIRALAWAIDNGYSEDDVPPIEHFIQRIRGNVPGYIPGSSSDSQQGLRKQSVYKRTESGIYQIPLLSWESLFRMVSAVYFNAGKKGKVLAFSRLSEQQKLERIDITTKVKLRVLLAISPKSGL